MSQLIILAPYLSFYRIEGHMPLQYVCQNMKPNEDLAVTLIKHGADLSVS